MRRRLTILTAAISVLTASALALTGCTLKEGSSTAEPAAAATAAVAADVPSLEGKTVGVAAKDIVHDFSRIVYQSVQDRVTALGGKVVATQAEAKDDKHVADIENLIAQKPDAIIVILGDATTLAPVLQKVHDAGIPLFTIDNVSEYSVNNVTSDNWQIGSTLARTIAEDIGGKGRILVFNGFPGVAPCRIRYDELKLVLNDYPQIQLIQPELQDKYEGTVEDAKQQITDALTRYPKGDISAIWSCWDQPEIGAAQAVDAAGRSEIKIYGVDADKGALDLISDPTSSYTATIAQQNAAIGAGSADNVARYLGGQSDKVTPTTYFAPVLITKQNVSEKIAELGLGG
ncbi:sugar ABC transporter substrate-binding protein [Microbacterium sp. SORGH_AS_0888]|uniref:sugar ABC transporter substrate-binding protein n=1 Tax=Microbacterium sp. SORGH_AS_0888 TaxID=3041791 RepID=UPI002786EA4B|nr:sugar ABC transporter substrate-binding protein [Microbacterium sp. SORGH_AS_0888]MDQ1128478.1 ribose transport system substrate-binding protein [Microbacterium sp. SORGH_AS_0888]